MVRPFQGLPIDTASHWPSAARRCCIGDTKDLPATIWIMKQDAYRYVVLSISCPCLLIFVQLSQKTTLIIFVVNAKHVTSHLHSRPQKKYQPAYSLLTSGDILLRARGLFVATWHGPHFPFKPVIASHTSGTPTILLNTHEKYLVYATTLPREVSTCCFRLYVAWRIGAGVFGCGPRSWKAGVPWPGSAWASTGDVCSLRLLLARTLSSLPSSIFLPTFSLSIAHTSTANHPSPASFTTANRF